MVIRHLAVAACLTVPCLVCAQGENALRDEPQSRLPSEELRQASRVPVPPMSIREGNVTPGATGAIRRRSFTNSVPIRILASAAGIVVRRRSLTNSVPIRILPKTADTLPSRPRHSPQLKEMRVLALTNAIPHRGIAIGEAQTIGREALRVARDGAPGQALPTTAPMQALPGARRALVPPVRPLSFPLQSGVTVSFSRQCPAGKSRVLRSAQKYAGLPPADDAVPEVGRTLVVQGSVWLDTASQAVILSQLRVSPSGGRACGRTFYLMNITRNSEAIKRVLAEARPGAQISMKWSCSIESNVEDSTVVRDVGSFDVIPFDADGAWAAVADAWTKALPEISKLIREDPAVWPLLSRSDAVDRQAAIEQMLASCQEGGYFFYDPNAQIAEVTWPDVTLWTEEQDGRTFAYGTGRSFILAADTLAVREIAIFLTMRPLITATPR